MPHHCLTAQPSPGCQRYSEFNDKMVKRHQKTLDNVKSGQWISTDLFEHVNCQLSLSMSGVNVDQLTVFHWQWAISIWQASQQMPHRKVLSHGTSEDLKRLLVMWSKYFIITHWSEVMFISIWLRYIGLSLGILVYISHCFAQDCPWHWQGAIWANSYSQAPLGCQWPVGVCFGSWPWLESGLVVQQKAASPTGGRKHRRHCQSSDTNAYGPSCI